MNALLRLPMVIQQTGLSRTVIYERIKDGTFPPPIKLSVRASAWPAHEIAACNQAHINGKSKGDLRILVSEMVAGRSPG